MQPTSNTQASFKTQSNTTCRSHFSALHVMEWTFENSPPTNNSYFSHFSSHYTTVSVYELDKFWTKLNNAKSTSDARDAVIFSAQNQTIAKPEWKPSQETAALKSAMLLPVPAVSFNRSTCSYWRATGCKFVKFQKNSLIMQIFWAQMYGKEWGY